MAIRPTYPGIYPQNLSSGGQKITGVATSVTAFIGRARRGPVDEPITIKSFGEFEQIFGGLWRGSTLAYAVRDFYLNGGRDAIIVRVVNQAKNATLTVDSLTLCAASPGAWGNKLNARIEHTGKTVATVPKRFTSRYRVATVVKELASRYKVAPNALFDLIVRDMGTGVSEVFSNLTVVDGPRRVDEVLQNESTLVRVSEDLPSTRPKESQTQGSGGSDGIDLTARQIEGSELDKTGLYALDKVELFNLLCIPPYLNTGDIDYRLITNVTVYCEKRRAMLIIDPPVSWRDKNAVISDLQDGITEITTSKNAAIFFPRLRQPNPLRNNELEDFAPCGAVAGVFARTDGQHGVWRAPAGLHATLAGVPQLSVLLTDAENGELNPLAINCLRALPAVGRVIWGTRTRQGDDRLASEWKYIPIRRLALYIQESLYRGTQWVVFEPNGEPLWAQIRLSIGAFMHDLFTQGAFQASSATDAYFVKCDKETTTQSDIDQGIVNIVVGFAPLKPAEFVIITLQQMAGEV